ncbi:MAG TPA: hypothetical protein VK973_00275 [Arenicellales bacterium]|nr:hypothetical protein [Arenicellales bacterium]
MAELTRGLKVLVSSEVLLALSIVVGIAVPPVSRLLGPWLYTFVFFLMLFSALATDLRSAVPDRHASGRLVKVLGWQMILLPALIGAWHRFAPGSGQWSELMFLTACGGTIFGAPAFARVMRLDTMLTLRGVLAGTLLMPLVLPLLAQIFTTRTGAFDFGGYALRFLVFIVVPLAVAGIYQSRRPAGPAPAAGLFNRLTIFFLVLFGVAVMDGIGERFLDKPWPMLGLLGFALAVHAVFLGLSALIFLRWGGREALTAGLLSGYRNMALLLAVGGSLLPPDFVVYVALWQIPMFVTPLVVRLAAPPRSG